MLVTYIKHLKTVCMIGQYFPGRDFILQTFYLHNNERKQPFQVFVQFPLELIWLNKLQQRLLDTSIESERVGEQRDAAASSGAALVWPANDLTSLVPLSPLPPGIDHPTCSTNHPSLN